MNRTLHILFVEDSPDDVELLKIYLQGEGLKIASEQVDSEAKMRSALARKNFDLIICDHAMPQFDAFGALRILKETGQEIPFIVVSGVISERLAIQAMKAGASDYLHKDDLSRLVPAMEREIRDAEVRKARRRAEQALGKAEERFRLMVERMQEYAIIILDAEGKVIDWNQGAERLLGYSKLEMIGKDLSRIFSRDQETSLRNDLTQAANDGSFENIGWYRRKNGELLWGAGYTTALYDENGVFSGFSKIFQDATQKKKDEEERESLLRQATEANRIKDEFLATMSHELRTPLNVILGHLELLSEESMNSVAYNDSLAAIRRNAHLQEKLVSDLLDISQMVVGKLRLEMRPLDVGELVERQVQSWMPSFKDKGLHVKTCLSPTMLQVDADPERLMQVFGNLLMNAIKFTPPGGHVSISTIDAGSHVEIIVEDTGQGISPQFLPYIFETFRQEDGSYSRRFGGLGLGLAIARHITELHGGSVKAESPGLGHGATFTISLPRLVQQDTRGFSPSKESFSSSKVASR